MLALLLAQVAAAPAAVPPGGAARVRATEVRRWAAEEAHQGVAVDRRHFYAIGNSSIGKYDKRTGRRVARWVGDGRRIVHLNSCWVSGRELVCANSNYPQVPMASSVEVFGTRDLRHLRSVPLGVVGGSLTWVERREGRWWAGLANYDGRGGEPGRDHRFTAVALFDRRWRRTGGYRFPDTVLAAFAPRSNSGGGWGDDGLLYVTGHDAPELYALAEPGEGPVLNHLATIDVPLDGQAWSWDRSTARTLYGITRRAGEVVVMTVPPVRVNRGSTP